MFFGDSLVNGTGDPSCLGWPGRVCIDAWRSGVRVTCYNLGVRAETSREILARWRAEYDPRVLQGQKIGLVFSYGTGDSAAPEGSRRVPVQESAVNTKSILEEAKGLAETLFVGPPPVLDGAHTERNRETSYELGKVCVELDVHFLDPMPDLVVSEAYMRDLEAGDGVHPGAAGYFEWASLVNDWLAWKELTGE
jgi:lysophospholipase L1-like esterase